MRPFRVTAAALVAVAIALPGQPAPVSAQDFPTPEFHHLHLNSIDPEAAIDFYVEQFPFTERTTFAGEPALWSPTDVLVLFQRVDTPPPTQPQSAFWHFGWHVADVQASLDRFRRNRATILPLYVERDGATVFSSGETWPSRGGGVGLTAAGIAEARAEGVQPTNGAGFGYLRGPDDALVEFQGNREQERFNHVHLYMEQPFCARLWYQRHLNLGGGAADGSGTEEDCEVELGPEPTWPALDSEGTIRTPSMNSMAFGDVSLFTYMNQTDIPLASSRGQVMDHFALSVEALDPWIEKLRAEGVTFLEEPYLVGNYRAIMIEGPSREAIELIEIPR
jgi:catechol 2,3-dioxygenase-like lactoylglutathione lyase family enzyme